MTIDDDNEGNEGIPTDNSNGGRPPSKARSAERRRTIIIAVVGFALVVLGIYLTGV